MLGVVVKSLPIVANISPMYIISVSMYIIEGPSCVGNLPVSDRWRLGHIVSGAYTPVLAFEKTSTGGSYVSPGAGIHPKATPVYRTRSNGRTSGNMTSLYDILAKCTVYSSLGRSEFRVNTL